ncbi:MAG: hypothetical protein LC808_15520 [Actinobacteria bacterium]|nr:hypothetical protein [Actinomycetota bacterium]
MGLNEFAQLLGAAGVSGIVAQYLSRSVERRQYAEVSVQHFLMWNDFGGLSI